LIRGQQIAARAPLRHRRRARGDETHHRLRRYHGRRSPHRAEPMDSSTPEPAADHDAPPALDAVEARIVGCLVEKQATTPDVYPLTENALVAACNQKTNRDPVLDLDPGEVGNALRRLEARGLVAGSLSARATRWSHRMDAYYGITPRQRAVLVVLLLRGPQTLGEIATRSERLADFPTPDDLRDTLDRLLQRDPALIVRLAHRAGQREDRIMHLLGGTPAAQAASTQVDPMPPASDRRDLAARVGQLETELESLRDRLDALESRRS
jgi:uncharacterized protein YceH (UPF0502 family)